jgi:hypothetical protein
MNGVELAGKLFRDSRKFCGSELKTLFFESPDYFTGQVPLYTVRLDDY